MGGDAPARPSLFQVSADIVSSRHRKQKKHPHNHHHHHNRHNHIGQQRRQINPPAEDAIATVSVIQHVFVDPNGSTMQVQTVVEGSTSTWIASVPTVPLTVAEYPLTTSATVTSLTETSTPGAITSGTSLYSTTSYPQSLSSSLPVTSIPFPSPPALLPISNSTSCTAITSANASSLLSNYTLSSTLSSSTILLTTTTSVPKTSTTFSLFPSSTDISTPAQPAETPTGGYGGVGGETGSSGGSAPTGITGTGGAGGSSGSSSPSTPLVIGGVVGGIAGIAFIVMFLIFLARWKKNHSGILPLGSSGISSAGAAATGGSGPLHKGPMAERSLPFAVPSALASLTGYKRVSQRSIPESTAGNERGFYRVSGRKLPSVLHSGGDGWGGPDDSPPSPLDGLSYQRDSGVPIMRPSPARTPVTSEGAFASSPLSPLVNPTRRPDMLGRSHPSQDGSHGSKFHEDV